jgi:hypothetical protein
MNLKVSVWVMIFVSFFIQYFVMSLIMTNEIQNITNSLGKFYISCMMGLLMGLVEVVMYDTMMNTFSLSYYIPLGILLVGFFFLYKKQVFIKEEQYLKEMIEHHSMALVTSQEILEKTRDYKVKKLASDIYNNQTQEIQYMKQLLRKGSFTQ